MSESSTTPQRKYIASSWTTLTIPLTNTFEDKSTEEGKKWISTIKPLTRTNLSGFFHAIWGRLTETPEVVWLVTGKDFTLLSLIRKLTILTRLGILRSTPKI
jgi:hypothetical protein